MLDQDNTMPTHGPIIGDPYNHKQFWTEYVRPIADLGKLEKIPTVKAKTKAEKELARQQNKAITTKSFGFNHPNFEKINWNVK